MKDIRSVRILQLSETSSHTDSFRRIETHNSESEDVNSSEWNVRVNCHVVITVIPTYTHGHK